MAIILKMDLIFKKGQVKVDLKTFVDFKKQVGKKEGKYKKEDGNKDLEISLCEYCIPDAKTLGVKSASKNSDIYENIDCIVGEIPIQVKCRKDNILTLEHEKIQEGISKGSWVDRSKAKLDLFVFEKSEENLLGYIIYFDEALKQLLNICRKYFLKDEKLNIDDFFFLRENSIDLKSILYTETKESKLFRIII